MKFFSIDLETTGLNPKTCQVLQIGAVFVDTAKPWQARQEWESLVSHQDLIKGQPYALWLNSDIIRRLDKLGPDHHLHNVMREFEAWARYCLGQPSNCNTETKFVAAGKNYAGFDNLFLTWNPRFRPHQRVLDPGAMYALPGDDVPPDLETCAQRANVFIDKTKLHDAQYDARVCAEIIYRRFEFITLATQPQKEIAC